MKTTLNDWIEYDSIDLLQENQSAPWYMVFKSEFVWPEFTSRKIHRPKVSYDNTTK